MCEQAVCWGLALVQEEPGSHRVRGELGWQVHQSQEVEALGATLYDRKRSERRGKSGGFSSVRSLGSWSWDVTTRSVPW